MSMQSSIAGMPKYGTRTVTVTQTRADLERYEAYRRKTAAFEEWLQKLNRGDRLPRGRFFKGKRPGRKLRVLDEFWQANASSTFDLSKMNPYDTLAIGVQPRSSVTAESLERFKVMEGIETPSPGARAFWASVEAKTDKPE